MRTVQLRPTEHHTGARGVGGGKGLAFSESTAHQETIDVRLQSFTEINRQTDAERIPEWVSVTEGVSERFKNCPPPAPPPGGGGALPVWPVRYS